MCNLEINNVISVAVAKTNDLISFSLWWQFYGACVFDMRFGRFD